MCFWNCFRRSGGSPSKRIAYEVMSEEINTSDKNDQPISIRESITESRETPLENESQTFPLRDDSFRPQPQDFVRPTPLPPPLQKKILLKPPEDFAPQKFQVKDPPRFEMEEEKAADPPLPPPQPQEEKPKRKPNPFANKKRLNPQDYKFQKLEGQQRFKRIGEINQQQFSLDTLKNCRVFLFDKLAACLIDDCEDCFIFVGPTESSVFVRNCKNCMLIAITSQFRVRDCDGCSFHLLACTQPVIQSSRGLTFSCIGPDCFSEVLPLMQAVNLSPVKNFWSQVYDFSKIEGSHRLSTEPRQYELKEPVEKAGLTFAEDVFLVTQGLGEHQYSLTMLLVLGPAALPFLPTVIHLLNTGDSMALRSHQCQLPELLVTRMGESFRGQCVVVKVGGMSSMEEQLSAQLAEFQSWALVRDEDQKLQSQIFPQWKQHS